MVIYITLHLGKKINKKVMTYNSVDVDLDDILNQLSGRELQRLVDDLYDDGYYQQKLENKLNVDDDSSVSINEQFFRRELSKISDNYLNLTNSEIQIIEAIAKRF
jgi:hypothetical protein